MPWKKGESGNPVGRPPKGKTLVEALAKEFQALEEVDGKKLPVKDIMAKYLHQAVVWGEIKLPNGDVFRLSPEMWMDALKWVYTRIDGPPKQELDIDQQTEFIFDPPNLTIDSEDDDENEME